MAKLADYDGKCPECDGDIFAGCDDITLVEDIGWVHIDCAPEDGFGKASRAGHTGLKMTLADKIKAGAAKKFCAIEGCDETVVGSISDDGDKTRILFCEAHRSVLVGKR